MKRQGLIWRVPKSWIRSKELRLLKKTLVENHYYLTTYTLNNVSHNIFRSIKESLGEYRRLTVLSIIICLMCSRFLGGLLVCFWLMMCHFGGIYWESFVLFFSYHLPKYPLQKIHRRRSSNIF